MYTDYVEKKSLKVKVNIGCLVTTAFELYTCCAIMLSLLNNLTTLNNSRLHQNRIFTCIRCIRNRASLPRRHRNKQHQQTANYHNLLKRSNPCYFLSMLEHLY
ncbi:hypothetical protein GQX74_006178 [Glossina fuscipes]|nr:hypothetical protein GQX74_006178 [Glossina fuscipes]